MTKKEITYRSKSLHGLFYASDHEIQKAKEIHELSPAGFEEHSEKYVTKLGWEVIKRSNHDGGIDIRALKEFKDGAIKKLISQCKHWKKPIGPDVLRELVGSAADEKSEHEKVLMVITSSRFTPGAVDYADRNDIILVAGDDLLRGNNQTNVMKRIIKPFMTNFPYDIQMTSMFIFITLYLVMEIIF